MQIFKSFDWQNKIMPRWRWCWRRRGPGRPFSPVFLYSLPKTKEFIPNPCLNPNPIQLNYREYEAMRLVDLEGLSQEEAAKKMKTSRGTIWRLVTTARKKVIQCLVESRPLILVENP